MNGFKTHVKQNRWHIIALLVVFVLSFFANTPGQLGILLFFLGGQLAILLLELHKILAGKHYGKD